MKMTPSMYKEVVEFIINTTLEQQMYFIQCIADRISINSHKSDGVRCYDIEEPFSQMNLNGTMIDINIYEE